MLWMCCGTFLYFVHCWDSIRGMRMDLIKCVLRGRSNDFVTAGIACVVFFRVRRSMSCMFVTVSLRNDGRGGIF